MQYHRILLKLSGESLQGDRGFGLSTEVLSSYAEQIKRVQSTGVEIGIVIGGGNIFRGLQGAGRGFDRVKGDQMGMLATIINSLALQSALESAGVKAKVLTSIRMEPIGEYYSKARALELLQQGYVVIIGGGTSNPYFSTDTASALRGIEIEAEVMFKGTRVDGIYTADPEKDPGRALRPHHVRRGHRPTIEGHGPDRIHALPRERTGHHRIRHGHGGQSRTRAGGRAHRNACHTIKNIEQWLFAEDVNAAARYICY